jgi:hypothetical protein
VSYSKATKEANIVKCSSFRLTFGLLNRRRYKPGQHIIAKVGGIPAQRLS